MSTYFADLEDARARTLELVNDLDDAQLRGPRLEIVNPLLWEIGHLAWFQERWLLRHLDGCAPISEVADRLYDSTNVAHSTRWDIPLFNRAAVGRYMETVLDRVCERYSARDLNADERYFLRLATFHEDMHGEAFTMTRQTLGYPRPRVHAMALQPDWTSPLAIDARNQLRTSDAEIAGGDFELGSRRSAHDFTFDNEKWAHRVHVAPFRMARIPVTQIEYARFIEDEGYSRRELWCEDGWVWRSAARAVQPCYWQRGDRNEWYRREYDRLVPVEAQRPMLHACWYEADAYCRWAGRRLPTEAEWELVASNGAEQRVHPWGSAPHSWEYANCDATRVDCSEATAHAAGDSASGCRQLIGNVWEWTSSWFKPYPGFAPDPYREYSAPWFHTHKVLRGGCFASRARMLTNSYRNFYTPDRCDVFAGFRTVAL